MSAKLLEQTLLHRASGLRLAFKTGPARATRFNSTTSPTNQLNWQEFLKLRGSRRKWQTVRGHCFCRRRGAHKDANIGHYNPCIGTRLSRWCGILREPRNGPYEVDNGTPVILNLSGLGG